jgi:hypothetical protein
VHEENRIVPDEPKRRIKRVPVSELGIDPQMAPKRDERFVEVLKRAIQGETPVYFAQIPLILCIPFDLDYRPDLHPVTASAIQQIAAHVRRRQTPALFVYPRGKWFVIADDYLPLFAAIEERVEYVPCWVLGAIENPMVEKIRGPISPREFRTAILGWE